MTNTNRDFHTEQYKERGFVVGADIRTRHLQQNVLAIEDSLEELTELCRTANIDVVGSTFQKLNKPNPATLIGTGKLEELQDYKESLEVDVFIFDDELSPRQLRGIEKTLDAKVIDRTALILDIFARHARTREGQLQVELAQLEYRLPRLTRLWTHLARQAGGRTGGTGGGVGLRGPGETQLEVDRREINRKIAHLKNSLANVQAQRFQQRERRRQAHIPIISLVGYTNAGKSTLLNALMKKAGVKLNSPPIYAANQLFATLDPTTRRIHLSEGKEVLFSDTVGFIQKLPTQLVASFRATLEEVIESDLLLHIVDITRPNASDHIQVVQNTLNQLEAESVPIITVFNKIDALTTLNDNLPESTKEVADPILNSDKLLISAKTGQGLDDLLVYIETQLEDKMVDVSVHIPYTVSKLVSLLHEQAVIEIESFDEQGTYIQARVPKHLVGLFQPYLIENN